MDPPHGLFFALSLLTTTSSRPAITKPELLTHQAHITKLLELSERSCVEVGETEAAMILLHLVQQLQDRLPSDTVEEHKS